MDKQTVKDILLEQHPSRLPSQYIPRELLFSISKMQKSQQIIVITGLKRCGKSTFLQEIRQHSKESDYFINFDDDRLVSFQLSDFQMLFELFIELYGKQKTFYFDEIQNIPEWERFVRRLQDQGFDILSGLKAGDSYF